jgi:hypothetical protein
LAELLFGGQDRQHSRADIRQASLLAVPSAKNASAPIGTA